MFNQIVFREQAHRIQSVLTAENLSEHISEMGSFRLPVQIYSLIFHQMISNMSTTIEIAHLKTFQMHLKPVHIHTQRKKDGVCLPAGWDRFGPQKSESKHCFGLPKALEMCIMFAYMQYY